MNGKLLVVEDDAETAAYLVNGLQEQGHLVDHAGEVRDGLFLVVNNAYDVMIVDRMLPGLDGLSMIRAAPITRMPAPNDDMPVRLCSAEVAPSNPGNFAVTGSPGLLLKSAWWLAIWSAL